MRKALVMICCICLGLMMIGCGTQTTLEIIMPDQPMTSSVSENEENNTAADTEKKEVEDTTSGNSYKIVYVDSAASYDCVTALATDNEKAGQTMLQALKDKGIESGTIGIMGVTKDTASCVAREQGFREAFEGTDYTLADTVYMEDDAQKVSDAVTQGMKDGYVGFFGCNLCDHGAETGDNGT